MSEYTEQKFKKGSVILKHGTIMTTDHILEELRYAKIGQVACNNPNIKAGTIIDSLMDGNKAIPGVLAWTSVEDGLPETCTYYLTLNDGGWCNYEILEWFDGWLDCLDRPTANVTHWMPLPEPPK